jgi:hypothetical protein
MLFRQFFSSHYERVLRDGLFFLGTILAFTLVLVLPFDRSVSALVRHGFNFWLLAAGAILYLGFRLERAAGWWLSFLPVSILFGLGLAGLWSNAFSEMQVVSGMLYFSDASQYYSDVLRLLHGFHYSSFSARHPLPTVFLALLQWVTGENLQLTLAVLVFFCALCVYLASRQVFKTWGALASACFILIIFLFYRRFIGMFDSENLGLALGCLAFVFISRASNRPGNVPLAGLLLLSLALAARPGAFLILPAVLAWFIFSVQANPLAKLKRFLIGTLILSSGFSLSYFTNALLAEPGSAMYSNLAYTLYGIAQGGKGWEQFLVDYPAYVHQPAVTAEQFAYQLAARAIFTHPGTAFSGLIHSAAGYFSLKDSSLFGFICGGEVTAFNQEASSADQILYQAIRLAAWGLAAVGMGWLWRYRKTPAASLMLFLWLGWLLSLPLIPSMDAGMMRVFAASLSYLAILPAAGLAALSRQISLKLHQPSPASARQTSSQKMSGMLIASEKSLQAAIDSLAFFLVFSFLAGPLLIKGMWAAQKDFDLKIACQPGETSAAIILQHGSWISLVGDAASPVVRFPDIRYANYLASVANFHRQEAVALLSSLPPGTLLANTLDLGEGFSFWVVMPQSAQVLAGERIDICGRWHSGFQDIGLGFFIVERWAVSK